MRGLREAVVADPEQRPRGLQHVEVADLDVMSAMFRVTFVCVALAFAVQSGQLAGGSLYPITLLFLCLQAVVLWSSARHMKADRLRPAVMGIELLVFCAWMRETPGYAHVLFTLFYLTVLMAAMRYGLSGSMVSAVAAIGLYLWQVPDPDGVAATCQRMGSSHFVPLLIVAAITGAMARVRDQEREARFAQERVLVEYHERVELARSVQEFSLPTTLPAIDGYEVAKAFDVADYAVGGGDYYDIRPARDGAFVLCVADIAGKTISGVAKLPLIRAGFAVANQMLDSPSAISQCLNELMCSTIEEDSFIAASLVRLEPATGHLTYTTAGQVPPLVVRADGETEWLELGGPALGIQADAIYAQGEGALAPGDVLVMASDGVTIAPDGAGGELGLEVVESVVRERVADTADRIAQSLLRIARKHTGGGSHPDDVTVVVVKRSTPGGTGLVD